MGRDLTMHSFVYDWRARHIQWGRAPMGRLVRSCRGLEACGLGPIMKSGVSDPSYRGGRLCRWDGFFWARFRATGGEGGIEEKLKVES